MLMKVFTIYDSKVDSYLTPSFFRTTGEIERLLIGLVNNPEHNFCKYSADFTLFEIGTWDDTNSTFVLHQAPYALGNLLQFKDTSTK